jgi:hypothetical protein
MLSVLQLGCIAHAEHMLTFLYLSSALPLQNLDTFIDNNKALHGTFTKSTSASIYFFNTF